MNFENLKFKIWDIFMWKNLAKDVIQIMKFEASFYIDYVKQSCCMEVW